MKCQRHGCCSDKIFSISAKSSDCNDYSYKEEQRQGYVPHNLNIGGGDYLEIAVCMDCGQLQGSFPVNEEDINALFEV